MLLPCWWENHWEAAGHSESLEPPLWRQGTSLGSSLTLQGCLVFMRPGWRWAKALLPAACLPSSSHPPGRGQAGEWGGGQGCAGSCTLHLNPCTTIAGFLSSHRTSQTGYRSCLLMGLP